ncbi:MAG: hypothetical protein JF612_03655 [Planctomycetia bacterium]|jgi:hypothetical protein|nr:hypothetical protein [Planctomycetia bacterium]
MKALVRVGLFFALTVVFVISASALPPLPKYIEEYYNAHPQYAKYAEMYKGLDMEHQCDSCHRPGVDKKTKGHALNDYGQAVAKNFKHRDFNKADKLGKDNAEEAAKAKKLIVEALEKANSEKNAAGQTFGDLVKAGQLPGKN